MVLKTAIALRARNMVAGVFSNQQVETGWARTVVNTVRGRFPNQEAPSFVVSNAF